MSAERPRDDANERNEGASERNEGRCQGGRVLRGGLGWRYRMAWGQIGVAGGGPITALPVAISGPSAGSSPTFPYALVEEGNNTGPWMGGPSPSMSTHPTVSV